MKFRVYLHKGFWRLRYPHNVNARIDAWTPGELVDLAHYLAAHYNRRRKMNIHEERYGVG